MKVIWSASAKRHRKKIALYIAERDSSAALNMLELFTSSGRKLSKFPNLGRPGRIIGTRELVVHTHYVLVYEVSDQLVTILAILHTSQQYPPE